MNLTKKVNFGLQELQLEEVDIVNVVDSSFVYPSFKSVKDKEMTEIPSKLIFHYKCDSNKCEFPIMTLKESIELKSSGTKETAEVIMHTIDAHQQLFTARQCGGYIFQAAGKSLVLIQNDSVVPNDETRFGFIDLTETRRRLIRQREMSKHLKVLSERNDIEQKAVSAIGGGCVGAVVVLAALKVLKKI